MKLNNKRFLWKKGKSVNIAKFLVGCAVALNNKGMAVFLMLQVMNLMI
jgi:hypothetical protein